MNIPTSAIQDCLLNIANDVSDFYDNINRGGCGAYAYHLAYHMINTLGLNNVKIRVYNYEENTPNSTTINTVEKELVKNNGGKYPSYILDWVENGVDFVHVVVEWNNYYWDSNGKVSKRKGKTWNGWGVMTKGNISLEALFELIQDDDNWNYGFDYNNIAKMNKVMYNHFCNLTNTMAN